jgi:hypothetical protein
MTLTSGLISFLLKDRGFHVPGEPNQCQYLRALKSFATHLDPPSLRYVLRIVCGEVIRQRSDFAAAGLEKRTSVASEAVKRRAIYGTVENHLTPLISSPGVNRRLIGTRLNPCPSLDGLSPRLLWSTKNFLCWSN